MTESPSQPSAPLAWNDHVGAALLMMTATTAIGTSVGWIMIRDCAYDDCAPLPPAARLLVVLGYTGAAAMFLGAMILIAPLRHRAR